MVMRSHVYQVLSDPDGFTYPWATVEVLKADGSRYEGPLYSFSTGPATMPNPFVVAPGMVEFYIEGSAVLQLKYSISEQGSAPRFTALIYTTVPVANMMLSQDSVLTMPTHPYGTSILRHFKNIPTWFQPSIGPHDHHGRAPGSTVVGLPGFMKGWATSFSDTVIIGVHNNKQPQYHFTYGTIAAYFRTWGKHAGFTWGNWNYAFVPTTSRDFAATTNIGYNGLASGYGSTTVGSLAVATDNSLTDSSPGALAFGSKASTQAGSISLGYHSGTPLTETVSLEDQQRISIGNRAEAVAKQGVAIGGLSEASQDAVALGFGALATSGEVEIAGLRAKSSDVSLPAKETVIPGGLVTEQHLHTQCTTFFGQGVATKTLDQWQYREPASGNEALDNIIYALRDVGLLSEPAEQPSAGVPHSWFEESINALSTLSQGASGTQVRFTNFVAPNLVEGRVVFKSYVNTLPKITTSAEGLYNNAVNKVAGQWSNIPTNQLRNYRVAVHQTKTASEALTSANQVGPLVSLLTNGTWSSTANAKAKMYKRVRLVNLSGVTQHAVTNASQSDVDARVIYLQAGAQQATATLSTSNHFSFSSPRLEDYELQVRTITDDVLLASSKDLAVPIDSFSDYGTTALVYSQKPELWFQGRQVLLQARELYSGDLSALGTLADHMMLGLAVQRFRSVTGSHEFDVIENKLNEWLSVSQNKQGTYATENEGASTYGNVLAVWFLKNQNRDTEAESLMWSIYSWHVTREGWFAKFYSQDQDAIKDLEATVFGCIMLIKFGKQQAANTISRILSSYRTRDFHLPKHSVITGYSHEITSANRSFDAKSSIQALMLNTMLGRNTDSDISSLETWRTFGVGYTPNVDENTTSPDIIAWYAFVIFCEEIFYPLPQTPFSNPGKNLYPGMKVFPSWIGS